MGKEDKGTTDIKVHLKIKQEKEKGQNLFKESIRKSSRLRKLQSLKTMLIFIACSLFYLVKTHENVKF